MATIEVTKDSETDANASTPVEQPQEDPTLKYSNEMVAKARADVAAGTKKVYRIYTDGIFDLFHLGHMNVLKQAKHALGNPDNVYLIAGVCSDADTLRFKGTVVMDGKTRAETVEHCKWVDEVVADSPWVLTKEFLEEHKIDFVAHDAIPYVSAGSEDVYKTVKDMGKFLATERTEGISTTDIIVQIVRDYDAYVMRNLQRGVDKKQLNVGKTWEIRAVAHEKSKKLDQSVDRVVAERRELVDRFKALKQELHNSTATCGNKRQDDESRYEMDPDKIVKETMSVMKHSWRLCGAMFQTSMAALSYLNVFSYIDMCRRTRKYKKDD